MSHSSGQNDLEEQCRQEEASSRREALIQQKKAKLYDLKNKLLKYDSFEEVPIEELETLCRNLNIQQPAHNSNSDEEILPQAQKPEERRHTRMDASAVMLEAQGYCRKAYLVKLKQVVVIVLVILCILVRNSIPDSTYYDMGEYSIYETRYQRAGTAKERKEGFTLLEKWAGVEESQRKVKVYLPKKMEKVHRKEQRELSYQDCINIYSPVCIDHRLSLYGSMNLQLENWVMDHFTGSEMVAFEASVDYVLSIVLTALKVKQQRTKGLTVGHVAVIQSARLGEVQLNSIRLSLIENDCQDVVEIVNVQHQDYQKLAGYQYILASQEFYVYIAYPFGQQVTESYPSTSFLLYMPKGVNEATKAVLKMEIMERDIYEIWFNFREDAFYAQQQLFDSEAALKKQEGRFTMIIVQPKIGENPPIEEKMESSRQAISSNPSPDPQPVEPQDIQSTTILNQQDVTPPEQRALVLEQHPCIQEFQYQILPIMSFFDKFVYINTVMSYRLLVPMDKTAQYKQKGAISPQLIFFLSQNIKPTDVVLFEEQLYRDDLILLTSAKAVNNREHFYCVMQDQGHPILAQNLRMNGAQDIISFSYLNVDNEKAMGQYYKQHGFNFFLTTFSILSRDYKLLYNANIPKIAVFYWSIDMNYVQFVQGLARIHNVWAILQRFEKVRMEDSCINYGLMEVKEQNVLQLDRSWLVVQM